MFSEGREKDRKERYMNPLSGNQVWRLVSVVLVGEKLDEKDPFSTRVRQSVR